MTRGRGEPAARIARALMTAASAVLIAWGISARVSHAQTLDPSRKITQYRLRVWSDEEGLPQNTVYAVLQLRDGTILAGTQEGLALFDGSKLASPAWGALANVGPVWVNRLLEDRDGTIWIATRGRGLIHVSPRSVTVLGTADGLRGESVESVYRDAAGQLFAATIEGGSRRARS
ncbi:MAG: hypothetical protein M3R07_11835 [Gemmatimonadota bacterium]|nr:hypothetical protein [Gemmatimonadota bacterium]